MSAPRPARPSVLFSAVAGLALLFGSACSESDAAATTSVGGSVAAGSCGKKGQPDCPLQSWMKANLQAYVNTGDTARLATAFDDLAAREPAGFDGWKESAEAGARAARSGDMAGAKAQCKHCHDQLRSKFRAEIRTTRLF